MKRLPVRALDPAAAADGDIPTYDAATGRVAWAAPPAGIGGGAATLDDLTDVDTTTVAPTNGQVLKYDAASGIWKPAADASGTGGGGGGAGSGATVVFARGATGASPLTVSTTGVAAGDLCLWAIASRNSTPNALGPQGGGWTKVYHVDVGTDEYCGLWYKIAGASEPASWTWTHAVDVTTGSCVIVYRGGLTSLVHAAFSGSGTTETKSVLGSETGLQVCVWHGNYQGGGNLALNSLDTPILTQRAYIKSTGNDQQIFIASRDTHYAAAQPPFSILGTLGNTQYKGAGVAVFD